MADRQLELGGITFCSLTFRAAPLTSLMLPEYKGSTFRGAFGSTFKQIACVAQDAHCDHCQVRSTCVYHYVFETPPPADTAVMRRYPYVPHPFVIEPPLGEQLRYTTQDSLEFGLKLIGRASDYLPYFVCTFDEMGRIGIGRGRGKYRLAEIRADTLRGRQVVIYDGETKKLRDDYPRVHVNEDVESQPIHRLSLAFITPTRIKFQEKLVLDLEFHMLIRNLLRRVSMLSYFHCGSPLDADYKRIIEHAERVRTVKRDLAWYDWTRYSARQDRKMSLGGFTGRVTFEGDLAPFVRLLRVGAHLHVGKATSFGLGRFCLLTEEEAGSA